MKKNVFILACFTLALCAGFGINRAAAQILANDDAAAYTNWSSGNNFGFGFGPWVMYNAGYGGPNGYAGTFLGNGDIVDSTNGNYWGSYANGADTAATEEFRAFSNSLPVNATFKIRWHNTGIGYSGNNVAGFNLRNGDNTNLQNAATFIVDGSLFSFYYIGGGSDNYVIYDGNGVNPVPINFNTGNSEGLTVNVTLLPNSMYNLLIENGAGTEVLWSTNDQPLLGSGTIDSLALYTFDTGGNQNFNDPEIFYLAPQVQNLTPANGSIYVPASSPLSFAVTSTASTINSNNIQLILNGVTQTGAAWTVTGSGTSSNQVTVNTPLQGNLVYNGTILATDAAGNTSSNTFSFNTWLTAPDNIYVEAADYNYGGGQWINNFTTAQPNQDYGAFDLLGEEGIDYFVFNPAGTNNVYRVGDLPGVEAATDVDHNNFAANGFQPYDLDFIQNSEWEDYTRNLSNNITYAVYARMATFADDPTMSFERMVTPQVSTTNQPGAVLGTFVAPQTGGTQNWAFVPLHDFFSNPVLINSGGTNTFRITDIGGSGSYNVGYLLFVAVTNNATLRPYVSAGFPYPGATGVNPENMISFTIANQQTSVSPASIQLFINSNNVTSGLTFSNNTAGTIVSYQPAPANLFPAGNNTATVIFSDGSVSQTNTWQFSVETLPTLPGSWALPLTANYSRGFSEDIAKGDDSAASGDFLPNIARAAAQLAGTLTNSSTGTPYANEALNGGVYTETNTINYAVDSEFDGLFPPTSAFPDIAPGQTNNVAMAADMYALLSPGVYNFDVYSDDGFQFSAGNAPASTNLILGIADYGRAAAGTEFSFIVTNAGLYPMQLIYFKAQLGGGGVELYSINQTSGAQALLNTSGSVPVYYLAVAAAPKLNISQSGNQVVLTWADSTYSLQSAPAVTGPYTTVSGATSPYSYAITGGKRFFRLAKP
ncbi:MAG TPA: hypothetical protein VME24_04750 [Alphaproteobacteria bacterium]|nr:hypothetical protein [Alphaproteobacteria bacterium]